MKSAANQDPGTDRGLKQGLLAAFRRLLRPLVRILIRHGIAYGEFAEVAKTVFVETAAEDFALPGRKSSGSRIAILTGLTRKEVKRLTDQLRAELNGGEVHVSSVSQNRATRVLSGWHQDPTFTGPYGVPKEIPFDGAGATFSGLVRRYSGDMPARAMLEELVRVNAVRKLADGNIQALSRYYIPAQLDPRNATHLGDALHDLAATIEYNTNPTRKSPARFERWVMTQDADTQHMEDFHSMVKTFGAELLEKLDDWLSLHEAAKDSPNRIRTRVGIYFYKDDDGDSEKWLVEKEPSGK